MRGGGYSALNRVPPSPPRMIARINAKNRSPYSAGGTGLILCCLPTKKNKSKPAHQCGRRTYPVSRHALPYMLDFLHEAVWRQDVNHTEVVHRV